MKPRFPIKLKASHILRAVSVAIMKHYYCLIMVGYAFHLVEKKNWLVIFSILSIYRNQNYNESLLTY